MTTVLLPSSNEPYTRRLGITIVVSSRGYFCATAASKSTASLPVRPNTGACRHGECGFFLRGCFRLCLRFRCICLHRRFRRCVRRLLRLQNDLRFFRRGSCADRQAKEPRQRRSLRAGRQATQQRQRKQQTDGTFHRTFPHSGKYCAFSITQFFLNLRRRNS